MKILNKCSLVSCRIYLLKILFSTVFISLITQGINAQVSIGPKVGTRVSWLNYDDRDKEEFKTKPFFSYSNGVTTTLKVRKRFILQADLVYSRHGKKVQGVSDPTLVNTGIYHYINTPILYRIDFKDALWKREFKWYLGAGPDVNFWLKGNGRLSAVELYEVDIDEVKYDIKFESYPANPDENLLYIENANRVQLGLIFASGLVFEPRPNQSILVELRFEWGHSYLAKGQGIFSDVIAYQDDLRARNIGAQLSVSYMIQLFSDGKKEKRIYYENK